MARSDRHRWWDWRVNVTSGESIRTDDKRGSSAGSDRERRQTAGEDWWWTLAWRKTSCQGCGRWISLHDKVAYNHRSKRLYCPACAQTQGIDAKCRPSRKLLRVGS